MSRIASRLAAGTARRRRRADASQGTRGQAPGGRRPVYESQLVTQLVNKVLLDGKKSTAESIVYGALEGCRQKSDQDPLVTLKRALDNIRPTSRSRAAVSVERPIRSRSRSVRAVRTPGPALAGHLLARPS